MSFQELYYFLNSFSRMKQRGQMAAEEIKIKDEGSCYVFNPINFHQFFPTEEVFL